MIGETPENATILIVDDAPANLGILFDFLTNAGFKVLVAESGESGIQTAEYALPDLILLDVLMPEMDGFEACRRLKANPATQAIPIIFATALSDTVDKVEGLRLGAVDYITKPLQYDEVLARVQTHLNIRQLTKQLQEQNAQLEQEIQERQRIEAERLQLLEQEQQARSAHELAQQAAEAARNRSIRILESITDAFFALDREWRFIYLNQQAGPLLQRQPEDLLGRCVWDAFPEAVDSPFYDEYHRAVTEQVSVAFEAFYSPLNTWFEVHAYPSEEGLSVYFQDINDRKRSQHALQQSEARFRRLFDSNITGMIIAELDGRVLDANDAFLRMVGYSRKDLQAGVVRWDTMTLPEYRSVDEIALTELRQTGVCSPFEKDYIRKDGSRIPVMVGAAIVDSSHDPTAPAQEIAICFIFDITQRRQAEADLHRQIMRSQLFAEVSLKIRQSLQLEEILQTSVTEVQRIFKADRVLILRLMSNGWAKVVTEAVNSPWDSVLNHNITDDCFGPEYLQTYRQGRVYLFDDIEQVQTKACLINFLRQFGVKAKLVVPILMKETLWGLLIAHQCERPRHWSDFDIELLQQLADQISIALAQSQLLEEETRQREELIRSNTDLQQFAYVASHDLQEPLRMVTSYLQLLERRYKHQLDANADDFIAFAVDGATRMQTLINDLLTYSRVGTHGKPFARTDCNAIVQQTIANLKIAIQEQQAAITYDPLPYIVGDSTQLSQLFQNLISNAIKFHANTPPLVHIASERQNGAWLFSVQDNGIGIESHYLDRIFVIFQRLHNRTQYSGTGIGLAVCKKIVERHGGRIWVESTLGQGSTFYFTIPDQESTLP